MHGALKRFDQMLSVPYDVLRDRYPGISTSARTSIVISRATERQLGGERDARRMIELYSAQLRVDDVLLYDDLIARARAAYERLSAHAIASFTPVADAADQRNT